MDKWYLRRFNTHSFFFQRFLFHLMDESMSSSRWKREGRHHSHFWICYLLAAYYFFVVKGKFRRLVCSVAFIFLLDLNSDSLQPSSLRFFFLFASSVNWLLLLFFFYCMDARCLCSAGWCSQCISELSALLSLSAFFCSIWWKQTWFNNHWKRECRHHPRFQIRLLGRHFIFRINHRWLLSFVSAAAITFVVAFLLPYSHLSCIMNWEAMVKVGFDRLVFSSQGFRIMLHFMRWLTAYF